MKVVLAKLKIITFKAPITASVMTRAQIRPRHGCMEIGFIQQIIYTIDIERYQRVLEHALSKVDFSVGTDIYMLPSNLNLNIGQTKGHNNKTLMSNADMKIGSNRDINRDHKKLAPLDAPNTVIPAVRHDPVGITMLHNLKMLTEKHKDEKLAITLLIVRTGLIA